MHSLKRILAQICIVGSLLTIALILSSCAGAGGIGAVTYQGNIKGTPVTITVGGKPVVASGLSVEGSGK